MFDVLSHYKRRIRTEKKEEECIGWGVQFDTISFGKEGNIFDGKTLGPS
jgi:hypothetical protein